MRFLSFKSLRPNCALQALLILLFSLAAPAESRESPGICLDFGLGTFDSEDVDGLLRAWLDSRGEIQEIQGNPELQVGFSMRSCLVIPVTDFLAIEPGIVMVAAPKLVTTNVGDLTVIAWYYGPGVSGSIEFSPIRLRAGVSHIHGKVYWDDGALGFSQTWRGTDTGFEFGLGLDRKRPLSLEIVYRSATLVRIRDRNNSVLLQNGRPIRAGFGGLELRGGVYLGF